eukprot:957112_1
MTLFIYRAKISNNYHAYHSMLISINDYMLCIVFAMFLLLQYLLYVFIIRFISCIFFTHFVWLCRKAIRLSYRYFDDTNHKLHCCVVIPRHCYIKFASICCMTAVIGK